MRSSLPENWASAVTTHAPTTDKGLVRPVPGNFYGINKGAGTFPPDFVLAELPPGPSFNLARERARILANEMNSPTNVR